MVFDDFCVFWIADGKSRSRMVSLGKTINQWECISVIIIVVACATTINAALSLVSEEYLLMVEDAKINKYHIPVYR